MDDPTLLRTPYAPAGSGASGLPGSAPTRAGLYFFTAATGAAGLAYEIVWQHALARILGSDNLASAVILATFLGGLSLGYYLCGKAATGRRSLLRTYALLEAVIGLWGLLFPVLFTAVETLTRTWSLAMPWGLLGQGTLIALLLMGLPTVCMGATIPFLTRALSADADRATKVHSTLYGLNAGGGALGALLAGFVLLPLLGPAATARLAAAINLAAALFFLFLPAPRPARDIALPRADRTGGTAELQPNPNPAVPARLFYAIAFGNGFFVMTLENVLIRVARLSIGSSTQAFTLVVAAFVLGIALGSLVVARLSRPSLKLLATSQLSLAALLLALYASLDTWPYWAHRLRIAMPEGAGGYVLFHAGAFVLLCLVLLLPTALMGAAPPLLFHLLKTDLETVGRRSGFLFAWNTAGNLLGSLIGGMAFYVLWNNDGVFLAAACLAALSAGLTALCLHGRARLPALAGALLLLLAPLAEPLVGLYDASRFMIGAFRLRAPLPDSYAGPEAFYRFFQAGAECLYYKDGPGQTVAVVEAEEQAWFPARPLSVMVNAKSDSSTVGDMYTIKLAAHLPALLAPKRARTLVVGLGTGVTAAELTLYPDVERIDVAEISPEVIQAWPLFDAFTHQARLDPRLRILRGDALRILARSSGQWDLIVSEPSNPWVSGVELLFTREFYRLVKERLTAEGFFLQWIHIKDADAAMLGMIANTLKQEFPVIRAFLSQENDLLLLAGNRDIDARDLARAEADLAGNPRLRASLAPPGMDFLDAILLREVWSPGRLTQDLSAFGEQTMDFPRLHFLAGRAFFSGATVPSDMLLGPDSAERASEHLLLRKDPDWTSRAMSPDRYAALLDSTRDRTRGEEHYLPMADALRLKAFLQDQARFPLTGAEQARLRPDLARLAMRPGASQTEWETAGLGDSSGQERAAILQAHARRVRNWINAYPLDGLQALRGLRAD